MSNTMKYTMASITALTTLIITGIVTADTYTVKPGDTLSKIAKDNNTTVADLTEWNKLANADFIQVGQNLEVGDGSGHSQATKATLSLRETTPTQANAEQAKTAEPAKTVENESNVYGAPAAATSNGSGIVLANGNTAGETGSYAARQMEARTGVSATVWEGIIARESNGDSSARNASGASGLFQTMPGWGSTATVEDQINAAVKAYNAQGLGAWNY